MALKFFTPNVSTQDAVIANGSSLGDGIDLGGSSVIGIQMPASWTAANLTFQASHDGVTYADLYDSAGEFTVTAAASRFIVIDPTTLLGARYLKVRSGTAGAAVNQGAARTLVLIVKPN